MGDKKKVYDLKTKAKAIKLHEDGVAPQEICTKLGIHRPRLYAWLKKKVEIVDEYEDEMLRKYGDQPNLTLEDAEALEEGKKPPRVVTNDLNRLVVENEMLQEELQRMRETVITMRAEARTA